LKTLTIIKFGGGLIDFAGTNIPLVVERITELKKANGLGPLAVFSAPKGVTDKLQTIGEASALGRDYDLDSIFFSSFVRVKFNLLFSCGGVCGSAGAPPKNS